jgi:hypothetical protein
MTLSVNRPGARRECSTIGHKTFLQAFLVLIAERKIPEPVRQSALVHAKLTRDLAVGQSLIAT